MIQRVLIIFSRLTDLREALNDKRLWPEGSKFSSTKLTVTVENTVFHLRVINNLQDAYKLAGNVYSRVLFQTNRDDELDGSTLQYISAFIRGWSL